MDAIIGSYDADFFQETRRLGFGNEAPVFIVGLPKSGTTLTEQLIALHPNMHGAGELPDFQMAFAAVLFPNARVVHCVRPPRNNGLSIWMENFSPDQQLSTDFEDMAFYYQQYRRLMCHWRSVLSLPILEVTYEDTVANFETQARSLIEFLDVEWNSSCLDFHKNKRAVQTPSRWQIRQPVYNKSHLRSETCDI